MPIVPDNVVRSFIEVSTRSEILILGSSQITPDYRLYHHHDGYPSGVGKFLMDEVYPLLMSTNKLESDAIADFLVNHKDDDEFEVSEGIHPDIEFQYLINILKKTITCYKCHYQHWEVDGHLELIILNEYDLKKFLPMNKKKRYA